MDFYLEDEPEFKKMTNNQLHLMVDMPLTNVLVYISNTCKHTNLPMACQPSATDDYSSFLYILGLIGYFKINFHGWNFVKPATLEQST